MKKEDLAKAGQILLENIKLKSKFFETLDNSEIVITCYLIRDLTLKAEDYDFIKSMLDELKLEKKTQKKEKKNK